MEGSFAAKVVNVGWWALYFRLFDPPEDLAARECYCRKFGGPPGDPTARENHQRLFGPLEDPKTWDPHRRRKREAYRSLFQQRPRKFRSWEPRRLPKALKGPYVLANQYQQYMEQRPKRRHEANNRYYENLLANREDPPEYATDNLSRAIRYAKKHHECFYEVGQVEMILGILDRQEDAQMQPSDSLENQAKARLAKLYGVADSIKELSKKHDGLVRRERSPSSPHSTASDETGTESYTTNLS